MVTQEKMVNKETFSEKFKKALVKSKSRRVFLPKKHGIEALETKAKVRDTNLPTTIPPIMDPNVEEVEVRPINEPYSYVRVTYNKETNEFNYEVIEPQLDEDEKQLLAHIKETLRRTLEYKFESSTSGEKEEYLRRSIDALLISSGAKMSELSKQRLLYYLVRDFIGYGKLDVMMIDPQIEDISLDGTRVPLYIFHRKHQSMRSNVMFDTDEESDAYIIQTAQKCGKTISVADPLLDATMPDGSRLQATLSREVTTRGSTFTVRRFRDNPFTPVDMLRFKTMSLDIVAYLWLAIEHGESMFVVGGTASGKTTTLNAILLFIPPQAKIVSIEDTREINIPHENWIAGLTREGKGNTADIDMFALLKASMRQRPQYMIIGEVRGVEAYNCFQAMATGKTVYSTIHADSVRSMVHRLENAPINLPRLLLSNLNLVMLQAAVKVGKSMTRRIKALVEIVGIEPETNELITNTVYTWNPAEDVFVYSGHSFLFEKIQSTKNLTSEQMKEEFQRRIEILKFMVKTNVDNHREVARIVSGYYRTPEAIMREVYTKLYGTPEGPKGSGTAGPDMAPDKVVPKQ
jgi:archaeal flagellar protein FlaI